MALVLADFGSSQAEDGDGPYNQLLDFLKLCFLALQFRFESCCLDIVYS